MIIKNHGKVLLATFIFITFTSISAYSFGVTLGVNNGEKKAIEKIREEEIIKKEKDDMSHMTDNKNKNKNTNKKETNDNEKKSDKGENRKKITRKKPNKKRSSSSIGASSNKQSPSNSKNIKIPSTLKDGTYYGQAQGFSGIVKVKVVVSGGSIYDVSVVSHSETPEYFQKGVAVINSILSAKSPEVDSISGATYTSNAIKAAVADALKNAGGSVRLPNESELEKSKDTNKEIDKLKQKIKELEEQKNINISSLKDGTYEGKGKGFKSTIKVRVKVLSGKIADIGIISANDDKPYIDDAKAILSTIKDKNSANVSVISGATYSSLGIKAAVRDALSKAMDTTSTESSDQLNELNNLVDKLKSENDKLKNEDIAKLNKKIEELEKNNIKNITGYRDGRYTGSGSGYKGDINLTVNVSSGKIESIHINQPYKEDSSYNKGGTVVKIEPNIIFSRIIEKQNANVDIISGATYTSRGLMSAVRDALKNAAINSNNDSDIDKEKLNESNERIKTLTEENTTLKNSLKILQKKYNELEKKLKELLESTSGKKDKKVELSGSETGEDNTQSNEFTDYTIKLRVVMKKNKIELVEDDGTDIKTNANKRFWEPIKENYLSQFKGKTYEEIDDVDVISESTYSSKSVKKSIKQAIEKLKVKSSNTTKK